MTSTNSLDLRTHSEAADGGTSATAERTSGRPEPTDTATTTRRTLLGLVAASAALTASSGAASGTDGISQNSADQYKRTVEQHYQYTAEGNLDGIAQIHTDDFVGHGFGPNPIDLEGLQTAVEAYKTAIPDLQFEMNQLVAEGNYVAAHVTASGTHDGRFVPLDLSASGAPVEFPGVTLHRFRESDGKIAKEWLVNDLYGFTQQAGQAATEIVDRVWEEALHNGNLAVVDEVTASDHVLRVSGRPPIRGPEGFKAYIRGIRTAFPDIELTVDNRFVDGTTVVDEYSGQATHQGEFMGIEPTGKQVEMHGVELHHIEGGQLVEDVALPDTWGLLQQLDAVDSPGG